MLVITRKSGQSIVISGEVVVTVQASSRVKVSIDAPKHVRIRRGEIPEHGEWSGQAAKEIERAIAERG